MPVALWSLAEQRDRQRCWRAVALAACCALQGAILLAAMHGSRSAAPLGAGLIALARIVALNIALGGLLGLRLIVRVGASPLWGIDAVPVAVALGFVALALAAVRRGSAMLRKAALAATCLFAAALWQPQVHLVDPQWPVMTRPGGGMRYYFTPILVWLACLLSLTGARNGWLRYPALAALCLLPFGIVADWRVPYVAPGGFIASVHAFAAAPAGARGEFPVRPLGVPPMVLVKPPP